MRQMTAMRQFGLHLGMCFQLKDDVLDYSDIEDIGKPTMNDIRDGKATLPLLISLKRATKEEADAIREMAEALANKSPHIDVFEAEQEIKSFVLRYDGIRYALRSKDAKSLDDIYTKSRSEGFMKENKRRIMIGNFVLSSGFYDAYYLKAQKARTLLINAYNEAFEKYDALLCPVAPTPAFKLGEKTSDPLTMYLEDAMTVPASMAGLPALSVPAGETKDGLPVGAQLIGQRQSDQLLLSIAKHCEEA
jgi:aspartyl-tRNA(Asn)/glutamyl-tRNA(Gln) amidotransferase subunit A